MNLADLERELAALSKSGQIGHLVALRVFVEAPEFVHFAKFTSLIKAAFGDTSGRLIARRHQSGGQLSLLWASNSGQTASVTVVTHSDAKPMVELLVIGNHGTAKLAGATMWELDSSSESTGDWSAEIERSLQSGTFIGVPAS